MDAIVRNPIMHRHYTPDHTKALLQETIIGLGVNAVVIPTILWLADAAPPQNLVGPVPLLAAIVPGAAVPTFVSTLIATMIIRRRVVSGSLPAFDWPQAERGLYRFIPENLLLRAVVLALAAPMVLVPTALAAVAISGLLPFTRVEATLFNVLYGIAVAVLTTRFVVLPALADRA